MPGMLPSETFENDWARLGTRDSETIMSASQDISPRSPLPVVWTTGEQPSHVPRYAWPTPWGEGRQGLSISEEVENLLEEVLENHVRILEPDEVRWYLRRHPELTDVVRAALRAVRKHLPRADLSLEVYFDPEIDDSYLAIYARQSRYDESFMVSLEDAEAEFLHLLADRSGWLQLTTDFREPHTTHGI